MALGNSSVTPDKTAHEKYQYIFEWSAMSQSLFKLSITLTILGSQLRGSWRRSYDSHRAQTFFLSRFLLYYRVWYTECSRPLNSDGRLHDIGFE